MRNIEKVREINRKYVEYRESTLNIGISIFVRFCVPYTTINNNSRNRKSGYFTLKLHRNTREWERKHCFESTRIVFKRKYRRDFFQRHSETDRADVERLFLFENEVVYTRSTKFLTLANLMFSNYRQIFITSVYD